MEISCWPTVPLVTAVIRVLTAIMYVGILLTLGSIELASFKQSEELELKVIGGRGS
jgi:hypothetical protein